MVKRYNKTCKLLVRVISCIALISLYLSIATIKIRAQEELPSNEKIENLLKEISQLSTDSLKIDRYIDEGWSYYNTEITTSIMLATKAEELSAATDNKRGLTRAKSLKAVCESIRGSYRLSNRYNEEAITLALELNDTILISTIYNCLAVNYSKDSRTYEKAYELYKKILKYNLNDTMGYITTNANLSTLFENMGMLDNQIKAINEIINMAKGSDVTIHQQMSMEYETKLLLLKGDTIQANNLLDALITKNINEGANFDLLYNYLDKSKLLQSEKRYNEALKQLDKSSEVIKKYGYTNETEAVSYRKALIYIDMGEYANAIKQLLTIDETKVMHKEAIEKLYEAYEKKGDYKSALSYAKKYRILNDSINDLQATATITELETMYNSEKKEKENKSLKLKSIEIENQLKNKNLLLEYLLAGLGIMVLLALFFYNQNLQRKKYNALLSTEVNEKTKSLKIANKNLIETNKELEAFTYVAAHDLMTPLRSITSFTGLLKKNIDNTDKKTGEYFSHIEKSSKWMNDLIEDLLVFTKLEKESYVFENIKVKNIIDEIKSHLKSEIELKNAIINVTSNTDELHIDNRKTKQVLQNIISNAIKYSKENTQPIIDIDIDKTQKYTQFKIKDNGMGVEKKYHDVIFEPFKRLHSKDQIEGTGIGLYICKKIVTKIGGTIKLESHADGTTFYITLPHNIEEV